MDIKVVVLNHNDKEFNDRMKWIKKNGNGKDVYQFEKEYVQNSQKRMNFISKLVSKCNDNTLILFHNRTRSKITKHPYSVHKDKEFLYISGDIKNKEREEIKAKMEEITKKVEYIILNFGNFEIEVEANFKILLNNGKYKCTKDIDSNDDIDDNFIEKYK